MKLSTIEKYQRDDYRHFSTVREFLEASRMLAEKFDKADEWAGGSLADAVKFCEHGDLDAVPVASKYADMINDAVELAGVRSEWSPDVVGAFPSVPAFLAGDPCSMWARSPVQDERGEIDVYFDTSADVKECASTMRRRGVCILALLLALQRVRNVRAHLFTSQIGGNMTLDFSYPLDVSEIAAFCGQPVITRRLVYSFCEEVATKHRAATPYKLYSCIYWAAWSERYCRSRAKEVEALRAFAGVPSGALVINQNQLKALSGMADRQFIDHINGIIDTVNAGGDPSEM